MIQFGEKSPVGAVPVWNVVFMDRKGRDWWDVFTRPGFRHVAAYGYVPSVDRWVIVDPSEPLLLIHVVTSDELSVWVAERGDYISAIIQAHVAKNVNMRASFGFWCTNCIKQLLGAKCGALTPYGLYRHMTASESTEVLRLRDVV